MQRNELVGSTDWFQEFSPSRNGTLESCSSPRKAPSWSAILLTESQAAATVLSVLKTKTAAGRSLLPIIMCSSVLLLVLDRFRHPDAVREQPVHCRFGGTLVGKQHIFSSQ